MNAGRTVIAYGGAAICDRYAPFACPFPVPILGLGEVVTFDL